MPAFCKQLFAGSLALVLMTAAARAQVVRMNGPYTLANEVTSAFEAGHQRAAEYRTLGMFSPGWGQVTSSIPLYSAVANPTARRSLVLKETLTVTPNPAGESSIAGVSFQYTTDREGVMTLNPVQVQLALATNRFLHVPAAATLFVGAVITNEEHVISGGFGSLTASTFVTITNRFNDNYGLYADDGLGDAWQLMHFGEENPLAAPGITPPGAIRMNAWSYAADLAPLDPTPVLWLSVSNQTPLVHYRRLQAHVSPRPEYAAEFSTQLVDWVRQGLTNQPPTEVYEITPIDGRAELVTLREQPGINLPAVSARLLLE